MPAPIVLFVYNRLNETIRTIEALKKNLLSKESELFVYCDGWKNEEDKVLVKKVRAYIGLTEGFKKIHIFEQNENNGLAKSIIKGVTEVVEREKRIIVLEDDLETTPFFLQYMNEALELYEKEDNVISIHGYNYPAKFPATIPETFFIKGADCWGWATWKRGWDLFNPDAFQLIDQIEKQGLTYEFDFNGSYPYMNMLHEAARRDHSWAIRWYASAFVKNKLTLYPKESLVRNIGINGTNSTNESQDLFGTSLKEGRLTYFEKNIVENPIARDAIADYFKPIYSPVRKTLKSKIKKILKSIW